MRFTSVTTLSTLSFALLQTLPLPAFAGTTPAQKAALHADQQLAKLDDGKIAAILESEDLAEVNASKYAQAHATNQDVREFAKMMVEGHTADAEEAKQITKTKKIATTPSEVSKSITSVAATRLEHLMTLSGLEFDRAYLEEQINVHRQMLQSLDREFIPAAQDKVFSAQLKSTREKVASHLAKAESLKTKL